MGMKRGRQRLVILDDQIMMVEALRTRLASEYDVLCVALSGAELLQWLRERTADCLLLELAISGQNGLHLISSIRRLQPELKILVVTILDDRVMAEASLSAGAHGFIPKHARLDELLVAISEVLQGRRYLSSGVSRGTHRVAMGAKHLGLARLTSRQQQIVLLMGDGKSGKEICEELALSASTVTFHKQNIMRTLGINSDGGLFRYSVLVRAGIEDAAVPSPGPWRARRR